MTSHLFYQTRQERPLLDHAKGVYLWDVDGKRYLDGSSGAMVSNIGHSHPHVLAAMQAQMGKSTFGYRLHFQNDPAEKLATKLAGLAPSGIERAFFVSGGSEAVESAIKLARQYALTQGESQRWKVISRRPSYHGATFGAMALTGMTPFTAPFQPMFQDMPKVAAPTAWADGRDPDAEATGTYYADLVEARIEAEGPDSVLAVIVEPIGGAATGALVPPPGYLARLREICDRHGVLLIHDEVMTGGGRTGRFFGAEHWQVTPDILAVSKGLGAGYAPLGAMMAKEPIIEAVLNQGGFVHGFTYAGNPIAAAAGLAVIEVLQAEGMMQNAETQGETLRQGVAKLAERYPFVGDVRGKGLLSAVELVADAQTRAPLPNALNAGARLVEFAYEDGLILYNRRTRDGLAGDHIMLCPPLCISDAEMADMLTRLDRAFDRLAEQMAQAATQAGPHG